MFLILPTMVFAETFSVIIPYGANNRLCTTFHNCYSPENITISAKDSIMGINKDSDFHSVTRWNQVQSMINLTVIFPHPESPGHLCLPISENVT